MKKVLLAPLDPVHDNAVKLLQRRLEEAGYCTLRMPPGTTPEEVVELALKEAPDAVLVSRTLGYKVAETLGSLVDLAEAAGLREHARLGIGGMAITREIGAELGFDGCFTGDLNLPELLAFLEGTDPAAFRSQTAAQTRSKPDLTAGYTYAFRDPRIEQLLDQISAQILAWVEGKTSSGVRRALLREEMLAEDAAHHASVSPARTRLINDYAQLCDPDIQAFYHSSRLPDGVRWLPDSETQSLPSLLDNLPPGVRSLRPAGMTKPLFFVQYGTGCPVLDVVHIKTAESWGADGVLHFDPSWGAQREGLLEGLLSHEHDGTIVTLENLQFIRRYLSHATLWNVRGHRGLNTPEIQVLAHAAGADLFKINIPYGGTAGGTDPARLTVDGVFSLRLAARYGIPFDIPGNDELSGVPPHKTFAGLLVMTMLGLKLGARPIPKPLLCYSPYMTVSGEMDDNMIEMNLAKLSVWREIVDCPVWPGEPIGFMTHTPDRVQSALTTAAHAALAASAGVDAVTVASSDEAYSRGPISAPARVDSLRAIRDLLRFTGSMKYETTPRSAAWTARLHDQITGVLENVAQRGDFVASLYEGLFGSQEDGLYPGRTGRDTVLDNVQGTVLDNVQGTVLDNVQGTVQTH